MRFTPIIFIIALAGCNTMKSVKDAFHGLSPYERYVKNLENANLRERLIVRKWVEAGERSLRDSVFVTLPFTETGHFVAHRPEARSYRFKALDGQVLAINGALSSTSDTKIFADLFIWKDNTWKALASADSSLFLRHEFTKNATCLLRIQPELLVNTYYSLTISLTPVLINPVSGASNRSIQSFYGDSREGGKRSHEGVDIFAKKGTPVIAPTDGTISRTGYTRLGGKVVWMYDQKRQHSYYFAHLDSQYVAAGMRLKQGDTLGTVGNTGNARYTPSHLHFGIYQSKSKDPLHYIRTMEQIIESSPIDTAFRMQPFRITVAKQKVHTGPGEHHAIVAELKKENYVQVVAQSAKWYRIVLPNQVQAYVPKASAKPALEGDAIVLPKRTHMFSGLTEGSVMLSALEKDETVFILATYGDSQFIRTRSGMEGWISL
jgi:peptidoglycan LD-endopeptidase LytH